MFSSPSPLFTPRDFQIDAQQQTHAAWLEHQRVLMVCPTGAGKAIMSAMLIGDCLQNKGAFICSPRRTLLLVNREELLQQALEKIELVTGKYAAIERGVDHAVPGAEIVVATIQSMTNRLAKYPQDHFGLVIVDEAHLFATNQARDVLDWFADKTMGGTAFLLGVTATPQTTGKRALSKIYSTIGYEIGLGELVKKGMLSNILVRTVPLKIDLRHVKLAGGDFSEEELDAVIRPYFRAVAESMQEHGPTRKWLCFLPLVKSSKAFSEILNEHGIPARHIDGDSPDRSKLLAQFKHDHFRALTCSTLLSVGYDEPSITGLVNLCPTKSRILLTQRLGRGTRVKPPGAVHDDLLVLDFLWQYDLAKVISPATLVTTHEEDEEELERRLRSGEEIDLLSEHRDIAAERHAALAKKLAAAERRKGKNMDLRQLMEIGFDKTEEFEPVMDYEPTMAWHEHKPSEKQLHALSRMGIAAESVLNKGHAATLLNFCFERTKTGKATFRQLNALKRFNIAADLNTSFAEASKLIGQRLSYLDAQRASHIPRR